MKRKLLLLVALSSCMNPRPATMGPDGVPVFEGADFRHAANTPFYCFAHTSARGDRVTSCHEIQEWCAQQLDRINTKGLAVLDACAERQQVSCLTFYRGDANKTTCHETAADCDTVYAHYLSPEFGARREQVTACTPIDTSFQPPS